MLSKLKYALGFMAAAALASPAFGQSIATIEAGGTQAAVTVGSTTPQAIVSSILSTSNGGVAQENAAGTASKTYTNSAFLANDTTGSMDIYGSLASFGYTPTVGDAVQVSGAYSLYNQIPELATPTAAAKLSSGNAAPAPGVITIGQFNSYGGTEPENVTGYMFTINNVTISSGAGGAGTAGAMLTGTTLQTTFGESAAGVANGGTNGSGYITDSSGKTLELYYWESSYSSCYTGLGGLAIPTGPVDVTGFFSYGDQFTPVSMTAAVPEPATLGLFGIGAVAMLMRRRSKKIAA